VAVVVLIMAVVEELVDLEQLLVIPFLQDKQ
jgi:hypothetical protein